MLTCERVEKGGVTVLRVSGEVDDIGGQALREAITACMREQRYRLVLNFASVNFLSFVGVGALMDHLGRLRSFKGDIKLSCVNLQTRRLLGMMGLGQVFEIYEVESAAVQGYKQVAA